MTRLVRMNEVQYVETEYDIERLQSEGFEVEELETEPIDDTEDTEEKPKRGGRKKAEA
nr:MAG TPA: hypothetical protein [Caudoviricetes sp.]